MAVVSNASGPPSPPGDSLLLRRCGPDQVQPALHLLLGPSAQTAHFEDCLRLARTAQHPAAGLWVAERAGQPLWACLSVVNPGRTLLLINPTFEPPTAAHGPAIALVEEICRVAAASDINIAQALLDPRSRPERQILIDANFTRLAELIYMHAAVPRGLASPALPPRLSWRTYGPGTHDLFASTILATYEHSLDCPALNGLRHIDDIIAGHRATGLFDPRLWFVLCEGDTPLGTLLLSRLPRADAVELVYLGLTVPARGRGLGDLMLRQAAAVISASSMKRFTLAVDAANGPALRLYWRHGLQTLARRLVFLRQLRAPEAIA